MADCPEYAFNEYVQIAMEQGTGGLIVFAAWIIVLCVDGIRNRQIAATGGIIALALLPFRLIRYLVAVVLDSVGFYRSCLQHCTGIRCSQECKRNAERMDASARISESVSVLQRERTIQGVYGMEQSSDVVRE